MLICPQRLARLNHGPSSVTPAAAGCPAGPAAHAPAPADAVAAIAFKNTRRLVSFFIPKC
jgi:hypothetical protein